jgi:glycosyltransferase involved in cell wall biosynthesis
MRIVLLSDWFSEGMGYAENLLPKAMAALGHDIHVVSSTGQVYFTSHLYKTTYEPFLGPPILPVGSKRLDGYTLHRLPQSVHRAQIRLHGLTAKLKAIAPAVVQSFDVTSYTARQVLWARFRLGFKLFFECHTHASVFPAEEQAASRRGWSGLRQRLLGTLLSASIEKCYPVSTDAAEIAERCYWVRKDLLEVVPLGVDTTLFTPVVDEAGRLHRQEIRQRLGFTDQDLVCIYTGRFSEDKDPLCLARAVAGLAERGLPVRGLFLGGGAQAGAIRNCWGCVTKDFVPAVELPAYYRAADVGVWPRQESTSQLDAASCGLPIIISNQTQVEERIKGNGLTYIQGDANDLAVRILSLRDAALRRQMGAVGRARMVELFSWESIARRRIEDYSRSLQRRRAA